MVRPRIPDRSDDQRFLLVAISLLSSGGAASSFLLSLRWPRLDASDAQPMSETLLSPLLFLPGQPGFLVRHFQAAHRLSFSYLADHSPTGRAFERGRPASQTGKLTKCLSEFSMFWIIPGRCWMATPSAAAVSSRLNHHLVSILPCLRVRYPRWMIHPHQPNQFSKKFAISEHRNGTDWPDWPFKSDFPFSAN